MLVLTILSIVTVSIILLVSKDIGQVVSNDKYEQSYNAAESQLSKVLDKYATYNPSLIPIDSSLPKDPVLGSYCNKVIPTNTQTEVDCTINADKTFTTSNVNTTITVIDKKQVDNFLVKKDNAFEINLQTGINTGYKNFITFSWDKPAALDFAITYTSGGTLQIIRDVYDPSGLIFPSLNNTYTAPSAIHPFNFSGTQAQSVTINTANIQGLGAGVPISLRITSRMKNTNDSISLTIIPRDFTTFPIQMREFTSTSYDPGDQNAPLAKIQTKIPLNPQLDNFFDYSFISN